MSHGPPQPAPVTAAGVTDDALDGSRRRQTALITRSGARALDDVLGRAKSGSPLRAVTGLAVFGAASSIPVGGKDSPADRSELDPALALESHVEAADDWPHTVVVRPGLRGDETSTPTDQGRHD